jgi:tRNA threonylcarbamoyladenosine biosynthesis protein TsaE
MSVGIKVETNGPEQTMAVGEKLGSKLKGGEFVELIGDVGAGKTVFVKGLARGVGFKGEVTSPTFTLENTYKGKLSLHHLDLYRLNDSGLIAHEISERASDDSAVMVVEWAGIAEDVLPKNRYQIQFKISGEGNRELNIYDSVD